MLQVVRPQDRAIVERLLGELAVRADGAIDFWTTVCLYPEGLRPVPEEFVTANREVLRSLAVCLRAILAEAGLADAVPVRDQVATLAAACRQLEEAMLLLARFRTVSLADIRVATQSLAAAHATLLATVRELGEALGCSVAYWGQRTPERDRYYQQILGGLFDLFRAAHPSGGHPQTAGR
jgi:hypothetical protein